MNGRINSQVLSAMALAAVLVFATTGQYAFGDNIQNNIVVDSISTSVIQGNSVTVTYYVEASGSGGLPGCDATVASPALVTFNVPAGSNIGVSPSSLTFSACDNSGVSGIQNGQSVTFSTSLSTPVNLGPGHTITPAVSDSSGNYNVAPGTFKLIVTAAPTDTTAPTVVSVQVSDPLIEDVDDGNTFTVSVEYSEAMDQTVNPLIDFTPDVSTTLTLPTGDTWSDSTHFSRDYTIADANVLIDDIDVGVKGAKDVAGNTQTSYDELDAFDIHTSDTTAPSVVSVTVSDPVISEADDGSTFTVTVEYDEAMDETVNPITDFVPVVSTTLTSPTGGLWSDSTHFAREFTVADANVEFETSPDVTVHVKGGKDLAGNTQSSYDALDAFVIDTIAPTVTGTPDSSPNGNGWYNAPVTIDWSSSDADVVDTDCNPDSTYYGPDTDSSGTSVPGGSCTDNVGNVGTAADFDLKYDETDPLVSLVGGPADGSSHFYGFVPAAPTCDASDPTPGSGLAGPCAVSGYSITVGPHTVEASATDNADNTATDSNSYTVKNWVMNGFYQPVDMSPNAPSEIIWNSLKGGQTAPLKFEIFAETEFTSTVFNSSPIGIFKTQKISCSADPTPQEDAMELTTTGGTTFRYDTTAGQFVQNWQTTKSMAGSCFTATFTAQDGSALTAYFKVK